MINCILDANDPAITCRICHSSVKKSGLLCQDCGLLCHTTCISKASKTCDPQHFSSYISLPQALPVQGPMSPSQSQSGTPASSAPPSRFPSRIPSPSGSSLDNRARQSGAGQPTDLTAGIPGKKGLIWRTSSKTTDGKLAPATSDSPAGLPRRRTSSNISNLLRGHSSDGLDGPTPQPQLRPASRGTNGPDPSQNGERRHSLLRYDSSRGESREPRERRPSMDPREGEEVLKQMITSAAIARGPHSKMVPQAQAHVVKQSGHVKAKESKSDCIIM